MKAQLLVLAMAVWLHAVAADASGAKAGTARARPDKLTTVVTATAARRPRCCPISPPAPAPDGYYRRSTG
jgi:hypothetical protein